MYVVWKWTTKTGLILPMLAQQCNNIVTSLQRFGQVFGKKELFQQSFGKVAARWY